MPCPHENDKRFALFEGKCVFTCSYYEYFSLETRRCERCPTGTIIHESDFHMRTSCQSCPPGMIAVKMRCLLCPAGSFSHQPSNSCKLCSENTFSNSPGQIEQCDECDAPRYVNEDHTECLNESSLVLNVPEIVYLNILQDNIKKQQIYDFREDYQEKRMATKK